MSAMIATQRMFVQRPTHVAPGQMMRVYGPDGLTQFDVTVPNIEVGESFIIDVPIAPGPPAAAALIVTPQLSAPTQRPVDGPKLDCDPSEIHLSVGVPQMNVGSGTQMPRQMGTGGSGPEDANQARALEILMLDPGERWSVLNSEDSKKEIELAMGKLERQQLQAHLPNISPLPPHGGNRHVEPPFWGLTVKQFLTFVDACKQTNRWQEWLTDGYHPRIEATRIQRMPAKEESDAKKQKQAQELLDAKIKALDAERERIRALPDGEQLEPLLLLNEWLEGATSDDKAWQQEGYNPHSKEERIKKEMQEAKEKMHQAEIQEEEGKIQEEEGKISKLEAQEEQLTVQKEERAQLLAKAQRRKQEQAEQKAENAWSGEFISRTYGYTKMDTGTGLPIEELPSEERRYVSMHQMVKSVQLWSKETCSSVSLLLNYEPKLAGKMLSHSWSGDITQTVQALERLGDEDVVVWYCTFSMYQKGWDWQCAGYTVDEQCKLPIAPFEQVIQRSDGMYIVHTTTGGVYTRGWCVYEMFSALKRHPNNAAYLTHVHSKQFSDMTETQLNGNRTCYAHAIPVAGVVLYLGGFYLIVGVGPVPGFIFATAAVVIVLIAHVLNSWRMHRKTLEGIKIYSDEAQYSEWKDKKANNKKIKEDVGFDKVDEVVTRDRMRALQVSKSFFKDEFFWVRCLIVLGAYATQVILFTLALLYA